MIQFEVLEDRKTPGDWIVGAVDYDSEVEGYTAVFTGPNAEQRAREYARWKNRWVILRGVNRTKGVDELRAENAAYKATLEYIAHFDRADLDDAKTLHYDFVGVVKNVLATGIVPRGWPLDKDGNFNRP